MSSARSNAVNRQELEFAVNGALTLHGQLDALARSAAELASAQCCIIVARGPQNTICACWPLLSKPPRGYLLTLLHDLSSYQNGHGPRPLPAPAEMLLRRLGMVVQTPAVAAVGSWTNHRDSTIAALVGGAVSGRLPRAAQLAARWAGDLISLARQTRLVEFWRGRAAQWRDQARHLHGDDAPGTSAADDARPWLAPILDHDRLTDVATVAGRAAQLLRCEAFAMAIAAGQRLRIIWSRGVSADNLSKPGSALRDAIARSAGGIHDLAESAGAFSEDRMLAGLGYNFYFYLLCGEIVFGLAGRGQPPPHLSRDAAQLSGRWAADLISWRAAVELEEQRALNRRLVRALFATSDAQRARMRRDLHDDFAQLLAAAQIALSGRRRRAELMLAGLRQELLRKLDSLRPAPLARRSLRAALAAEAQRLEAAGIRPKVTLPKTMRISRLASEACYRIVREGVSNVIRHSGASSAAIEVALDGDRMLIVAVSDNGKEAETSAPGIGLRGLSEHLALLGGSCRLQRRTGLTRLVARIPVLSL